MLGQEQDEVGRNFSAAEAFDGSLTQLNMWDYAMDPRQVQSIAMYRCDHVMGNIIAWSDFYDTTSVHVKREESFCKGWFNIFY